MRECEETFNADGCERRYWNPTSFIGYLGTTRTWTTPPSSASTSTPATSVTISAFNISPPFSSFTTSASTVPVFPVSALIVHVFRFSPLFRPWSWSVRPVFFLEQPYSMYYKINTFWGKKHFNKINLQKQILLAKQSYQTIQQRLAPEKTG